MRRIVACDGDDTLWIADSDQRRWEDDCNRRGVEGLPHPGMSDAFRRYLREFGCVRDGVTRALHRSCRDLCGGELPAHWSAQVEAIPEMAQALNLRCRKGIQDALEHLKRAGYALWLITKGDLVRQAIKLSCFNFINLFDVVEIVDRKNVFTYRRVLAANGCPPCALTMVADSYWQDVVPVVRLGGRAVHLIGDHSTMLRTLEQVLPTRRIRVCRRLDEVPAVIAAMV